MNKPKKEPYFAEFYDEERISEYLKIVKGTKMELPVLAASFYGFRRSEVLGLRDNSINMKQNMLTVKHTVTIASVDGKTREIRENRTKTFSSLRSMPIVDIFAQALAEAQERQAHYRRKLGSFYQNADSHYLCRDEYGALLKPNFVSHKHRELLEKHNLPHIRFHDLRHSCATLLLANNVPLEKIKEWLGHTSIETTKRYAHLKVSMAKEEMAAIMKEISCFETYKTSL